jgi:D-sedoheptulose 7-phosphate isomerase
MKNISKLIDNYLEESIQAATAQKNLSEVIEEISLVCIKSIESGGKLILFGNGGSASDSQHIAAELIGRFQMDRKPLPAISLSSNISVITALGNDFGYESIFLKQIQALVKKEDVVIALSTSGTSPNILEALDYLKKENLTTIGLTGNDGGKMKDLCDYIVMCPSSKPSIIQQSHITIGQLLCLIIEDYFFSN